MSASNANQSNASGISIQHRNTGGAHGPTLAQGAPFHHHDGGPSTFKAAQRESAKIPGAGPAMGVGSSIKRKQAQESAGGLGQHGADSSLGQSAGGHSTNMGRKGPQKHLQGGTSLVSPQKKGPGIGNERAPGSASGPGKADMSLQNADGPVRAGAGSAANAEASLFNKHYNKELKLCEDEIPMVLCELNESAMAYLGRDQFDNALLLLQKAHGVLDVVDLSGSRRDQFIAFQLFHNMAMCYQKQGQLEECALCLETTLDHLGTEYAGEKNQSLAVRIYKLKLEVRLRLQFCAILSQLHRHKEALEQALEGIKIAHLIVRDKISVCRFYSKRIDFQEMYGHAGEDRQNESSRGRERSGDSHSRSEFTSKPPSGTKGRAAERRQSAAKRGGADEQSKSSFRFEEDLQAGQNGMRLNDDLSMDSIGNYQTEQAIVNNLDGSISLIEKTSKKLLPIYKALLNKISYIESKKDASKKAKEILDERTNLDISQNDESSDESRPEDEKQGKGKKSPARPKSSGKGKKAAAQKRGAQNVDLRHILGFLNQTEWIQNLNIGNIMQIGPLKLEDLTLMRRNEECLSRESFLEVISFLIVGYFCASTEIRFIIQLKDEISKFQNFSTEQKTQESELWHTMSLDIACSFLPSDCPLLNHILLSYQKHHAPSQSQIPENQALDEKLRVIKPHAGIDNSKFQPIIRTLGSVKIDLASSRIPPAQKRVTKLLKGIQSKHLHAQEKSMALIKQVQGGNSNTPVAQQAPRNNQHSPKKMLSNFQALKLVKLEKIVGKFAKDVGYDKKQILRFLLGEQPPEAVAERRRSDATLDGRFPLGAHSAQPSGRPQSHKESLGSRQNLEAVSANTGMAAKLAYNNLRKYGEGDVIQQNLVANPSQASMKSAASQNWRLSPQSFVESRNGRQLPNNDNHFEQDRLSAGNAEPASQAVPLRIQGQKQGEKRLYDSESSHRDSSFLHDLSQVHANHHDKSFNEQLDERSKFALNQSDMNMELQQHHNFSIGAIGGTGAQGHGGTVRQSSKRVHSHERGKVQRPRSSKGYRGAQHANQSQTQAHSHANSNGASNVGGQSMQHQMSAHHLHTGGLSSMQASTSLNANNAQAQKFHTTKSEERALKTSQNQRSLVNKGQRQKTAGAAGHGVGSHNTSSHASHGFTKEPIPSGMQSKKLASLNSQLQSQSSTQLPSAQVTGGLQKLTKKQIQQIQQHHAQQSSGMPQHPGALASGAGGSQLQSAAMANNLVQYSSLNSGNKGPKMKMNYDDLKKFLIKEQNSAQVQQLLQQHAALGSLNAANSQSQTSFAGAPSQIGGHIEAGGLLQGQEGGGRGRSQPGAKSKKMAAQSQSQLSAVQALGNQQKLGNVHSAQSLEKLEQIQVSLDESNNQSINYQTSNNRDIKDLMFNNPDLAKGEAQPGQAHHGNQSKKAKQIIAQARKATGGAGGHQSHMQQSNGQFQQVSGGISGGQSHQSAQQAQQIYLNSLAPHGQARPNSSHKYSAATSTRPSHNQLVNHREANSKSALATVGKHQSVGAAPPGQGQTGQSQNQGAAGGGSASIKRREKGRLIMQEWLTKSGQNVSSQGQLQSMQAAAGAGQHVQLLAAQAAQIASGHNSLPSTSQHQQHSAPTGKNKFVPKQIGGFDLNPSQISSLTKQQQQQLHQLQLAKQNMAHGLDRSISQQNNINVKMTNE